MGRLKRRLFTILLVVTSTLVALLLGEFLVRRFDPQALVVPWQDEIDGITAPRAGVSGRHFVPGAFDVRISYSGQRFRGSAEYEPRPSNGVLRIAALGDSFTFGYGADDRDAYPAQLERLLNPEVSTSGAFQRAEVINAGSGGTGTGEQALWFDIWVKRFHPHFVALGVTSNDLDDDIRRGLFLLDIEGRVSPRSGEETTRADRTLRDVRNIVNAIPGYGYLAQRSHLLALIRNTMSHQLASSRTARMAASVQATAPDSPPSDPWTRAAAILEGEIAWLDQRVKKISARLLVVFIPSRESVYESDAPWKATVERRSSLIRGVLARVCDERGIPYRDLTAEIRSRARSSPVSLYYSGLDTHPTPEGYTAIASAITALLAGQL